MNTDPFVDDDDYLDSDEEQAALANQAVPEFITTLLDHAEPTTRHQLQYAHQHTSIEYGGAADGWMAARIDQWSISTTVYGKRVGDRFLYKCDCGQFRSSAPLPCWHIVLSVAEAVVKQVLDVNGVVHPDAKKHLLPGAKPNTLRDPVAAVLPGGEIQLITKIGGGPANTPPIPLPWKPHFDVLRQALHQTVSPTVVPAWPDKREILYVIDAPDTLKGQGLVVEVMTRDPKKTGTWRKALPAKMTGSFMDLVPNPEDRAIIERIGGGAHVGYYGAAEDRGSFRILTATQALSLLPQMCATGRCVVRPSKDRDAALLPVAWDDGGPWEFEVDVARDDAAGYFRITGKLVRGDERKDLREPPLVLADGLVFFANAVAPLKHFGAFQWIVALRARPVFRVPLSAADELRTQLYTMPAVPRLQVPADLSVQELSPPMRPRLHIAPAPEKMQRYDPRLVCRLEYDYEGTIATSDSPGAAIMHPDGRSIIRRDRNAEHAALQRVIDLGCRSEYDTGSKTQLRLNAKAMPLLIRTLMADGWYVEAEGKLYRRAGNIQIDVTSGIDWFDLTAHADFDGQTVALPALLAALRKGESVVQLGDGTFGVLPEEWLKKYGGLAQVGKAEGENLRFRRSQAGLLDALLASQPQATFDDAFRRTRDELRSFAGVAPIDPPSTFIGELRAYQREALGWFEFLRKFGFGGCLADDMGLGKTVQVLALLESRRAGRETVPAAHALGANRTKGTAEAAVHRPSMVVVPRSLVFNWKQEAARFAPQLKVLDHTTPTRSHAIDHVQDHDIVLTTYGTLRKDAIYLKDVNFDYIVLDEAQAIKNPASESAKATRVLNGAHRLALSGTPVQNHLGDLWSLFDFLNPGMLGAVSAFSGTGSLLKAPDEEARTILSRGMRPFILRRTKDQVAKDLPQKLEQTLYCELEPEQRKLYNDLRDHYRAKLMGLMETKGLGQSKIQVLEALLRLRQAACHPGLIDKTRAGDPSAKLDVLLPKLVEAHEEGHKVLVFSQFTSFLSLLKTRLNERNIIYEYLDGKTRDRQARVDRFQTDPECKLFLISLKAGGLGLNLTAADYVFLLDPWWNPAIEAQAIDRSHRIGQTRQVFACRLIARETVEEKVLALQQSKRELADAIINADNSLIRTLGREDIEMLLS